MTLPRAAAYTATVQPCASRPPLATSQRNPSRRSICASTRATSGSSSTISAVRHAATGVCALVTIVALLLARRIFVAAAGGDPASSDDVGQLLFLAQLGLLIGAINLALILLEGSYVLFIPRG